MILDLPILHAVQGDSAEADCFETTFAMSEPCIANGGTPESFGRVLAHTCSSWGACIMFLAVDSMI